ncbi:hypothetical protein FRC03_004388 [Tulasnella sp. 419]|nr:hypothetical protein FRC03_004388 [Tulasnella sp. 419]
MIWNRDLLLLLHQLLGQIRPRHLPEETVLALHKLLQNTFIAALDLVDRGHVIRNKTPWGRTTYEVRSASNTRGDSYRVFMAKDITLQNTPMMTASDGTTSASIPEDSLGFCSCPAFAYAVLASKTHVMCKHLLAAHLADRLDKFTDRTSTEEHIFAPETS